MRITPKPSPSSKEKIKKTTGLNMLLRQLTEPTSSIQEPERRRRARLLSASLIALFLLGLLTTIPILYTVHQPIDIPILGGTTFIFAVAYILSRTRYYNVAALLIIITLAGTIFAEEIFTPNPIRLYFLMLSVLVSSLFFSLRHTIIIIVTVLIGMVLLFWEVSPALPLDHTIGAMFAVLSVGVLGIVNSIIHQSDQQEIHMRSASLRQSEERFHLVSYATNDVVWDWDLLTNRVWRNQNAQRLFGFREDQMTPIINWWETHIHPDEREKTIRSLHAAIENGETFWSTEYQFQRADDSYIYVFDRAYIIHDEATGKPIRALGAMMDITTTKKAEEILREEALRDPLTGLFNRRYMKEMLEREFNRAKRTQQQISIIMLDIDYFKQVNDTLGHAAGDALLHALGLMLLSHVRGTDIACRYGGDEFILILPGATRVIAQQRAEKICLEARGLIVEQYGDLTRLFSLSIGVAVYPEQGSSQEAIFTAVDAALYAAKAAGRNQVVVSKK